MIRASDNPDIPGSAELQRFVEQNLHSLPDDSAPPPPSTPPQKWTLAQKAGVALLIATTVAVAFLALSLCFPSGVLGGVSMFVQSIVGEVASGAMAYLHAAGHAATILSVVTLGLSLIAMISGNTRFGKCVRVAALVGGAALVVLSPSALPSILADPNVGRTLAGFIGGSVGASAVVGLKWAREWRQERRAAEVLARMLGNDELEELDQTPDSLGAVGDSRCSWVPMWAEEKYDELCYWLRRTHGRLAAIDSEPREPGLAASGAARLWRAMSFTRPRVEMALCGAEVVRPMHESVAASEPETFEERRRRLDEESELGRCELEAWQPPTPGIPQPPTRRRWDAPADDVYSYGKGGQPRAHLAYLVDGRRTAEV